MILHLGISDKILLFWQQSYISPSNDVSFLQWKFRTESCPACEEKEMSKWPRFQLPSQVSPILSPWERGSGDWPSGNQSPLFCLWFSLTGKYSYVIYREANQEYRKRRVCSWTNKINPVSVFILRVSETASSRLQTPLSLPKTSRTSRFSQYPFSFQKAWNLIQCCAFSLYLPENITYVGVQAKSLSFLLSKGLKVDELRWLLLVFAFRKTSEKTEFCI